MKAVLVGINKYGGGNDLQGCVNDVLITRDILRSRYAVLERDIRMLVDYRATKQAIMERLEWLVSQSKKEKNLLFHYSGHGAQVPNKDYTVDREVDGFDEVMCPVDFDWVASKWISDDEIYELLKKKEKDCRLVMIFDCCHSGTVFRNALTANDIVLESKPRCITTPVDIMSRIPQFEAEQVVALNGLGDRFWGFEKQAPTVEKPLVKENPALSLTNTIVLTACEEYQTAADAHFRTRYQGAFSYCLQKFLYYKPELSVKELEESAVRYLKSFGFSQDPIFHVGRETNARRLLINS